MRVLHVGEYVSGGVATYIKEVISYQKNQEEIEDIHVCMSATYSETDIGVQPENIHLYDYNRSPFYFVKAMNKIRRVIKEVEPDIIHVHSTFAGFFVRFPLFFAKKKAKIVYCSHGWSFLMDVSTMKKNIYALIEKILCKKTDLIINISEFEHKNALQFGMNKEKSVMINNGVSEKVNDANLASVPLKNENINLLFIGRYDRQKGLDILVNFFKENQYDHIKLYIIGDNVLKDHQIEIPENIVELGWIDNENIDYYYSVFDAVIVPSRWEGFGLVTIEAMKNKKPVIASNRGALPYLVKSSENGYVFDLDNLETLKEIFQSLNKEELKKLGEQGYQRFKAEFTSDKMNDQMLEQYKQLCSGELLLSENW